LKRRGYCVGARKNVSLVIGADMRKHGNTWARRREYLIMATKTTYLCDRCGAEVAQTPQSPLATVRVKQTYGDILGFLHMPDGSLGFECCTECLDALRVWFADGREPIPRQ
jgi:hypothetical protein